MVFKGNVSTFNPPDLLMFLSHMEKEGMLSVTHGQEALNILIKKGMILDAHSGPTDKKLLTALFLRRLINNRQLDQLSQIQKETGLPVRQIFEKLKVKITAKLGQELKNTIMEVLFRFCLMKQGDFQFVDISVESDPALPGLPCQSIVFELIRQTDDWLEMIRRLGPLDQIVVSGKGIPPPEKLSAADRFLLKAVSDGNTLAQLIELLPLASYQALQLIHQWATRKWIRFTAAVPSADTEADTPGENQLLSDFKQTYRRTLLAEDIKSKTEQVITYCREQFEETVLLTAEKGHLTRFIVFSKNTPEPNQREQKLSVRIPIEKEPVFAGALRSGRSFFGDIFPSELIDQILPGPRAGTCALMLLENTPEHAAFLFVFSDCTSGDVTPFHYLELLAWLITPPKIEAETPASNGPSQKAAMPKPKLIDNIVSHLDELPPMPHNVTRVLQLLADPDKSVPEIAAALSEDQAMVARLLKVSNSVLYRTGEEIKTLRHALARLGTKTIRNLVLSASTRALFPMDQTAMGMWSRALWQHAKECALSARCVAQVLGSQDPEEAFAGGMLHDVGKLVILIKCTDDYRHIRKKHITGNLSSTEAEQAILGFDHTQTGKILMGKWQMPPILSACASHHHQPEKAGAYKQMVRIIAYGNCLSNLHGTNETPAVEMYTKQLEALKISLEVSADTAEKIESAVISDLKQADIFD